MLPTPENIGWSCEQLLCVQESSSKLTTSQREGREAAQRCVRVCVHMYTPHSTLLPSLVTCPKLATPPPIFYTMPFHPLSSCFHCTHSPFLIFTFSSTSITLPSVSCPSSLTPFFPSLLVLTAHCVGRGRGEAGSYPRSLSTSDEHMGNGAGSGEWGGYYPGGAGRATTTGWTPGWEGTLPPTPSRGDKDSNWRSPAKDPNGKWNTPPSPGVCVCVCTCMRACMHACVYVQMIVKTVIAALIIIFNHRRH